MARELSLSLKLYVKVSERKTKYELKPRPNDRNMSTQHIATLLGATCCMRLATVLRCVATCWKLLAQVWKWSNLSQQHPTCRNTSQHGGQTHATCCAQQCCDMLHWHVAIVWPGLKIARNHITYLTNKEASTVLCSVVKHAGSGRARQKCRGKHET